MPPCRSPSGCSPLLAGGPTYRAGWLAAAAVALLLTVAGAVASRANGDGAAGATLGGYALPYAFTAGALAVGSGDPVGPFGPARWVGAPELLAGSVALLLVALIGLLGVASRLRVFVAGVTVGLIGAGAALGGLLLTPAGTAAVLLSALVFAVGVIPLLAIRLGKLPLPPITLPTAAPAEEPERARDLPDRGRVHAAVTRTEEMLTGMLIGHAAAGGGRGGRPRGGPAERPAGCWWRSPRPCCCCGRGCSWHCDTGCRRCSPGWPATRCWARHLSAGPTTRGGWRWSWAVRRWPWWPSPAGTSYARRPVSPYVGRVADLTDTALVVAVVPIACAVLDLYDRARGLLG